MAVSRKALAQFAARQQRKPPPEPPSPGFIPGYGSVGGAKTKQKLAAYKAAHPKHVYDNSVRPSARPEIGHAERAPYGVQDKRRARSHKKYPLSGSPPTPGSRKNRQPFPS